MEAAHEAAGSCVAEDAGACAERNMEGRAKAGGVKTLGAEDQAKDQGR